ncbi:SPW repeat domain-containing protein [Streptomyces stelliscabiei]|nr:SPW repeat protein [Streptomyces stelliscabiei]
MATVRNAGTVRSERDSRQILLRGQRQQIIGLFLIICALVLLMAPWIAGYPETAKDAHRNELGVGLIVLFLAMARFLRYPGAWSDLAVLAAGAWVIASPWGIGRQNTEVFDGTQVTDVVVGIVLVVLSGLSLLLPQAVGAPRSPTAGAGSERVRNRARPVPSGATGSPGRARGGGARDHVPDPSRSVGHDAAAQSVS